ncbi:winged helix-turn-helix domain-containing protein [Streptomyces pathocidini]|uniref:Winged helix-turn-helix domain-containing protein n=1 Tax=Streptomyces pathocidini TaxID=1650571 RepID=A0ABW7UZL7_9ACTN|nr:winged helix-turn-helix domain-containing protein [Streptomyces pathocidini]
MSVEASDLRPKPVRVADAIRERIKEGRYQDGKLPTVEDLVKEFKFASQTVRDGMRILIGEGLVFSSGNRGYFVSGVVERPTDLKPDASEEIKEMRLQIQELTERVAALEERANPGGARSETTMPGMDTPK